MSIWICTKGQFADMEMVCAFGKEAVAKAVSAAYGWNKPTEVEYDRTLPIQIRNGLKHYELILYCDANGSEIDPGKRTIDNCVPDGRPSRFLIRPDEGRNFVHQCWARDANHASQQATDAHAAAGAPV